MTGEKILMGGGRRSGRTETLLKAINNNCIVVCVSDSQRDAVRKRAPTVRTIGPSDLEKLRGLWLPVLPDHYALEGE